jgi:hypothetical protein
VFKGSIFLFKVHDSFKVTFNLIISGNEDKKNTNLRLINKFSIDGNDYIKITPYPYLMVDISARGDKKEGWSTNSTFRMNRQELFKVIQRVKRIYSKFTTVKDLFYYDQEQKLTVSPKLAAQHQEIFECGEKTIKLQACVVERGDIAQTYEGVFLIINKPEYFSYLTYEELGYFLYELTRIDMTSLSIQLINTIQLTRGMEVHTLQKKDNLIEEKEAEINDIKPSVKLESQRTIPEI